MLRQAKECKPLIMILMQTMMRPSRFNETIPSIEAVFVSDDSSDTTAISGLVLLPKSSSQGCSRRGHQGHGRPWPFLFITSSTCTDCGGQSSRWAGLLFCQKLAREGCSAHNLAEQRASCKWHLECCDYSIVSGRSDLIVFCPWAILWEMQNISSDTLKKWRAKVSEVRDQWSGQSSFLP